MTRAEQELVIVLNREDTAEGFILATSTWPRWTRFLDRLVADGVATLEHAIIRDGKRDGGNYRVQADALRISRRRRRAVARNGPSCSGNTPTEGVSDEEPNEEGSSVGREGQG